MSLVYNPIYTIFTVQINCTNIDLISLHKMGLFIWMKIFMEPLIEIRCA